MKLSIVGGGNLGSAIAKGYREADKTANITVSQPLVEEIRYLEEYGINVTNCNMEGIEGADIVIIAVKPYNMELVMNGIKDSIKNQVIVSVVTGKSLDDIERMLGRNTAIFRAMPNIAIAYRQSMTCISYRNGTTDHKALVEDVFGKLGEIIFVNEKMMDACTVMAGSGIAFALRFIRSAMQAGIQIGFDSHTSLKIVNQVVNGATALLNANGDHPEQEIDRVTTPQGCTIAGLNKMEHEGFSSSVIAGIQHSFEAIEKIKQQ